MAIGLWCIHLVISNLLLSHDMSWRSGLNLRYLVIFPSPESSQLRQATHLLPHVEVRLGAIMYDGHTGD